ncbi:hypothetical protein GCM10010193_44000 [Kitasatospora atroaurantiaca]|uniref:Uncharacterized protein n=1 Tax=Kitasatospora atroaurantiaca TaxID=285545 RepID=A0A561ETM7_9ACTN|nr:hypothetical protein [Kitasatospora atroaurantiaca]TWE18931.1 hypothetical protein FB465_4032 [Kitasatospora atroaurantiaca]
MPVSDDQPHTRTRLPVGEQSVYQASGRQPRPLRTLLTVLLVVALLVLAISIANRGKAGPDTPSADRAKPSAASTAASGQEPVSTTSNGIANGYPHTDQGAQSAAANYAVALGSAEMFRTDTRHTVVATIADPTVTPALQARLDEAFSADTTARFGLDAQGKAPKGLTFVSRTVPVGTKTTNSADTATKVDVWCTGLVGLAGERSTQPVAENWYTLTLTMRWTGSDWKLTDFSRQSGPAPVPGDQQAATAEEITGAVQDFGGFRYAR